MRNTRAIQSAFLLAAAITPLANTALSAEHHNASDAVHAYVEYGRHHLSSFAGLTHVDGGDYNTGSLEYEYRINGIIGVGAVAEHAGGEFNADSYMATLDVHPFESGMIFQFGVGKEFRTVKHGVEPHAADEVHAGAAHDIDSAETEKEERITVARAGLLYEYEFGRFTLAPQVHWDYHHHEANSIVYGVSAGVNF